MVSWFFRLRPVQIGLNEGGRWVAFSFVKPAEMPRLLYLAAYVPWYGFVRLIWWGGRWPYLELRGGRSWPKRQLPL